MATVTHSLSDHAGAHSGVSLRAGLDRLALWYQGRRERAAIIRGLRELDARDLRDLNIRPSDFSAIADGTYRR
jgi:hypothetical protein